MLTIKSRVLLLLIFEAISGHQDSKIESLKRDFRETDYSVVRKLELEEDKTFLVDMFNDFDRLRLEPVSKFITSLLKFENLRSIPHIEVLKNDLQIIEGAYEDFRFVIRYLHPSVANHDHASKSIITGLETSIRTADMKMKNIYNITFGDGKLISTIIKNTNEHWCTNEAISAQQLIFSLYNIIALNDLKCYIMARFKDLFNGHFSADSSLLIKPEKQLRKEIKGVILKTDIRRCDPDQFLRGKNYIQFTKVLQGFIKSLGGEQSGINFNQRCSGTTTNCMAISSTGKVCVSSFSNRRFDYIEEQNGRLLGKRQYCKNSSVITLKNEREICICDVRRESDRFISLRTVMANIQQNRVVTGIKFAKPNRVVHIQIQEGTLLPNGYIDPSTVQWVPINDFDITDHGQYAMSDFFLLSSNSRTIAVDEIVTDEDNYVITGIGFRLIGDRVQLEIKVTEFDWMSGKLNHRDTKTLWNHEENRIIFAPPRADIPTYTDVSIIRNIAPMLINFTNTDWEKDAGQTTVPFLDAQEVTSTPATPLIGAGLFYKGRLGYGGFIAPVIKTYDYFKKIGLS